MPEARKRPCAICRRWFRPDALGDRQHACGKPECQTRRRQKTQASWRRRNPEYAIAWRIDQRAAQTQPPPEVMRLPEVYRLHPRTVDVEGYVSVHSIRYSVPVSWIGRRVEVRETRDKIEIELDARHLVTHVRAVTPQPQRITLAEHRPPRGEGVRRNDPHPEEQAILSAAPEIAAYVTALKQKGRK